MLSKEQIAQYREQGYLKVPQLFTPEETAELASEMVRVIEQWGQESIGWCRPLARSLPRRRRPSQHAGGLHAQPGTFTRPLGARRPLPRGNDHLRAAAHRRPSAVAPHGPYTPSPPEKGTPLPHAPRLSVLPARRSGFRRLLVALRRHTAGERCADGRAGQPQAGAAGARAGARYSPASAAGAISIPIASTASPCQQSAAT